MVANEVTRNGVTGTRDAACRMGRHVTPVARVTARHDTPVSEEDRNQELANAVSMALTTMDSSRLRPVSVVADAGQVRLTGRVHSYYAKQLAQMVAMAVEGVQGISNDVVVECVHIPE
jgi:osmotically-inducible protein OsmY